MARTRLLYVMDPMCSWCWGFAPVADALAEQARAAGVPMHLVAGGLRTGQGASLDPNTRRYILEHWHAVHDATGQPFRFDGRCRTASSTTPSRCAVRWWRLAACTRRRPGRWSS